MELLIKVIIQVILGIIYASILEWFIHKWLLHYLGKRDKNSIWRFHFKQHHRDSRKYEMIDSTYLIPWYTDKARAKEVLGLFLLFLVHLPLWFYCLPFAASISLYTLGYYLVHRKSHLDKEWGKKWLPHHWKHHMKNQEQNWCVFIPIADYIFGTNQK